jgi:hypothetical protein
MKTFENYFLYTATQPATKMFPNNYVKQTLKDLELRQKYLPKALEQLNLFKESNVSKKDVCLLACHKYPYSHPFERKTNTKLINSTIQNNCQKCHS